MTAPSSEKLARELEEAGLPLLAYKARQDWYHDFLAPDESDNAMALDRDLLAAGTPAALALRKRHHAGEFDAPKAESDAWAKSPEGQAAFAALVGRPSPEARAAQSADAKQIGRLAMRQEGGMWNAYYALTDTMRGAIPLGGVRMQFIERDPARKEAFMALMQEAVADILEDRTGHRPSWRRPKPAPEHERGGNS